MKKFQLKAFLTWGRKQISINKKQRVQNKMNPRGFTPRYMVM